MQSLLPPLTGAKSPPVITGLCQYGTGEDDQNVSSLLF
jgi:hypothetical protein